MSLKKGQYVLCKFRGSGNGDLVVGYVKSVRRDGDIVLVNLLTGKRSIKREDVVLRRNAVTTKRKADRVIDVFKNSGKAAAREAAVSLTKEPKSKRGPGVAKAVLTKSEAAIAVYRSLSRDEQCFVARVLWGDALSVFGVA